MKKLLTMVMLFSSALLLFSQETFVRKVQIDPPASFGSGFGTTVSGVDLDGDGKVEIYSVNGMSDFNNGDEYPQIIKYELNGTSWDSVWAASFPNERQNTWAALTTGDLDGDGNLEVIWGYTNSFSTNTTPPRIVVFENSGDDVLGISDGAGNYTPNASWDMDVPASTNMRPLKWKAVDIDGDGTQEVVFAERRDYYNFGIISTSDVPNNGDGSETWSMELNAGSEFYNQFVRSGIIPADGFEPGGYGDILTNVDIDGDGLMDLFICNDNTNDTAEEMHPRLYKYEFVHGAWILVWQTDISSLVDAQNTWPSLNVADMDGDGKMEVVWNIINNFGGSSTTPARVVVFEASGDSTVDALGIDDGSGNYLPNASWDYGVADSKEMRPLNVKTLDIDSDGKDEIVLAERKDYYGWLVAGVDNIPDNGDGSETWTLEGNGTGPAGGSSVYRDMAVIGTNIYINSWSDDIIKVSFDGTNYTEGTPQSVPFWSFKSMTTVDIDGDGTEEILAVNYSSPAKVYLLQEDADSLLVTELADLADVGVSRAPGGNAGDIDGDGNLDFIMGGRSTDVISRLEYNGSGSIADPNNYTLSVLDKGISPEAGAGNFEVIDFADLDGDNSQEVFYTSGYQRGLSTGAFPLVVGHYSDTLKADAGRRWDMAIANGMAHFFNGSGDVQTISYEDSAWVIRPSQKGVVNGAFLTASAADLNGDGVDEMFVGDWYDAKVKVLVWNNGAWASADVWDFTGDGGNRLNGGAAGDIDGDGNMEFIAGSRQSTPNGQIYRVEYLGGPSGDLLDPANYAGEVIDQELLATHTQYEVINVANLDDDPELEILYTSDYARGSATATDPQVPIIILDVVTVQTTPIADVRVDANNDFVPDNLGAEFTIDAVVTSPRYSSSSLNYYVQDATGGIFLYGGGDDSTMLNVGQRVQVTGTVAQFNGLTELSVTNIVNLGTGTVPDPVVLTVDEFLSNAESYEGTLVKFEGVGLLSGSWPSGANKNLTIWDGFNSFTARIDKDTDLDDNPEPTWPINLTGIVGQYDSSDPRDGGYQVMFTFYADLTQNVDVSPNPNFFFSDSVHALVDGQVTEVTDVNEIYPLDWHPAVDLNNDPLLYQVLFNDGTTETPMLSDNFGQDTVITLSGQDILDLLNGADSVTYSITIMTTSQKPTEKAVASADTISITIVDKYTGVEKQLIPKKFFVDQNYPNPFNPTTIIRFGLPTERVVDLRIYDILGREVVTLVRNQLLKAGVHEYNFNAGRLASGTYIYRLTSNNKVVTKKMMLVK